MRPSSNPTELPYVVGSDYFYCAAWCPTTTAWNKGRIWDGWWRQLPVDQVGILVLNEVPKDVPSPAGKTPHTAFHTRGIASAMIAFDRQKQEA